MLDAILYSIIALFIIWETIAHFAYHNVRMHTLSNRIAWLESHGGWPVRALVGLVMLALGLHIEGAF